MDIPTPSEIRLWAPPLFDWASYGFRAVNDGQPDPLAIRIEWAAGTLFAVTGRTLDSIPATGRVEETSIAQKVLAALLMLDVSAGSAAALAVMEQPWLKSMSAGSYSESRFSPSELAGNGKQQAPPFPGPLWVLLWALMTDEMRDEWNERLSGRVRPEIGFVPLDVGGLGPGIYDREGW